MTRGDSAIRGAMASLYDVFVDWEGRLGRELPQLKRALAGARRVLDVGCGTGRHVKALLGEGFDAHGADASDDMLEQARAWVGEPARLHRWRLGKPPGAGLEALAPFDAVVCLGNVWPQLLDEEDVRRALDSLRGLLRPGGLLLVGLKAVEIRRGGNPYLPLLRRVHEGKPIWFLRFVDFDGGRCDFHMVVVRGGSRDGDGEALFHRVHEIRAWGPEALERAFRGAGFDPVSVSARLGDPSVPPETEDVFVHAVAP